MRNKMPGETKESDKGGAFIMEKITITISGMHCVSCGANIQKFLKMTPGIFKAEVNFSSGKADIEYDSSKINISDIEKIINDIGYKVVQKNDFADAQIGEEKEVRLLKIKFFISAAVSIPLLYFSMGHHLGLHFTYLNNETISLIQFVLTTLIVCTGYEFYFRGIISVLKNKMANMDTLIALGTGSAYLYSMFISIMIFKGSNNFTADNLYYESAGMLIVFILLGNWLGAVAKGKTSQAIKKLLSLNAKTATVLKEGEYKEIDIDKVVIGDIILIKPGQKLPVDGEIINGYSSIDESMITGESFPSDKKIGDIVIGGTINKSGTFTFKATKVGNETMLAQIIKLVESAQNSKAHIQELADKIASYFVPSVLIIAITAFAVWFIAGYSFSFCLSIFITVLIIACPCALGLATPAAIIVSTGLAATKGILVKNAQTIQIAEKIDTVVFDKTGTLTNGNLKVTDFVVEENENFEKTLSFLASAESYSEHPIAKAILEYADKNNIKTKDMTDFKNVEGKGISAKIDDNKIYIGKKEYLAEQKIKFSAKLENTAEKFYSQCKTVVWVGSNEKILGIAAVTDTLKESAKETVSELQKMGKQVYMITGDNAQTAFAIAKELNIDTNHVTAGVLPKGKIDKINALKNQGLTVAMAGDGINDAPALAAADVGIAIGTGIDAAIESASIVLLKNDLRDILTIIKLSSYTMKKIKQNLFWAFFYNFTGIPVAAGILYPFTGMLLSPVIAGAAMAFSSISVVLNSLTIKKADLR